MIKKSHRVNDQKDHIITNAVIGLKDFQSAIIQTELSNHFLIVFALRINETTQKPKKY